MSANETKTPPGPFGLDENEIFTADFIPDGLAVPDLGELLGQAEEGLKNVDTSVRRFVSDKPVIALVGAVAAGFLIGRLLSR